MIAEGLKLTEGELEGQDVRESPELQFYQIKGRFFEIFRRLLGNVRTSCPNTSCSNVSGSAVESMVINKPYPELLILDINWDIDAINSRNALYLISSLPAFDFVQQIFMT